MNTVYRRKTKQPLYLVSSYFVSCIYKCSCVYFWQHIFVSSVCVCVCVCVSMFRSWFFFFCTAGKEQQQKQLLHPLVVQMQKCCKLIFALSRALSMRITLVSSIRFWICCRTPADRISTELEEIKQVLYRTEPPSELSKLSEKVCPTNNATLPPVGKMF